MSSYAELDLSERILMGPGPSMVDPRVYRAIAQPVMGHLDPKFLALMSEVQELLRYLFQTENKMTIPVSGTGSAGMEAALCNFIEPGDDVLICTNGYFSNRMCEMVPRYGANLRRLEKDWGEVYTAEEIGAALKEGPVKLVGLVHGETSTGTLQPMDGIADVVHEHGALLVVDTVASLGGVPYYTDEWDSDVVYSGSQKCLSCPPGLAPLTVGQRAMDVLLNRSTPVANWYLDLSAIVRYWGETRTYHHTAPVNMVYALRESLRIVQEEGLEARWARHRRNAEMLWDGLEDLGLELLIPVENRLPVLTTVKVPEGVDELGVRRRLLTEHNIEIAGGLGVFAGKIWRIGLMGYSSSEENVRLLMSVLKDAMAP